MPEESNKVVDKPVKATQTTEDRKRKFAKRDHDARGKSGIPTKKPKVKVLTRKERKVARVERRKKENKNYELSARAKQIWETARREDCKPDTKTALAVELHTLLKGKIKDLIFAHDTSRVVECLMAIGTADIRSQIFEEMKVHTLEMIKSRYAKFFVMKMLKYGSREQKTSIMKAFHGHVARLLRHAEAASCVEYAYNEWATATQRSAMLEEFYGPTFALFKDNDVKTLRQVLEKEPHNKLAILKHMKEKLQPLLVKKVINYSIAHQLLLDYFNNCGEKAKTEMIELVRDHVVEILHTKEGSRVAMQCVWYGTVKDRKVIVKALKGHVVKMCQEEHGHIVLLALFDAVDDTVVLQKTILTELSKNLKDVIVDPHGRKVILYLLAPRDKLYFHPDVSAILQNGDGNPISKKDTVVRRKELLEAVSKPLMEHLALYAAEIMRNPACTIVALAIINHCKGDVVTFYDKLCELLSQPYTEQAGETEPDSPHFIEDTAGHLFLKKLIAMDKERHQENCKLVLFGDHLLSKTPADVVVSWTKCNRGCFVLLMLVETEIESIVSRVKALFLGNGKAQLKKSKFKGAQLLHKKI